MDYSPAQRRRVVEDVGAFAGAQRRTTVEQISERTGVQGRTVRQILSDCDGVVFVLGADDAGVFVATVADDTERMTRRLFSQAQRMRERAERRRTYAAGALPTRQQALL